jgi:hypothetical protein
VSAADEYVREISATMSDRYVGDCLKYAKKIRELLRAEGRSPWIGRIRKRTPHGDTEFHWPLHPLRFRGRGGATWTTHYVCICDGHAYDPLVGEVIPLAQYSVAVFGEPFEIERMP